MSTTIKESASISSDILFDFPSFTADLFLSMLLLILDRDHVIIFGLKKQLKTEYTSVICKSAKKWYLVCLHTS